MNRCAFFITKPIQLINALNILDQTNTPSSTDLLILDSFADAESVYNQLQSCTSVRYKARFLKDRDEFLRVVSAGGYQEIFIDSDVGLRNLWFVLQIKARSRNARISVYEEGIGTYRNDLFSRRKSGIYKSLGVGSHFGGCKFISTIHVYNPELYRSIFPGNAKKVREISNPAFSFIKKEKGLLNKIFSFSPPTQDPFANEDCFIYLTSWNVRSEFFEFFKELSGTKYVKLHPAIRDARSGLDEAMMLLPNRVPAELLIANVEGLYKTVTVFHEGSSTSTYVDQDRVRFIELSEIHQHLSQSSGS